MTAHSAWCAFKKSGTITVKLKRPELTNPQWKDREGNPAGKGLAGEALKLCISCNEDMEEGAGVIFRVYPEGADVKREKPVVEIASTKKDGKAEAQWTYRYVHDEEKPLKEKPKFFFTAISNRSKEAKSGSVEIGQNFLIEARNGEGILFTDTRCSIGLSDGTTDNGRTDAEGKIRLSGKVPGIVLWIEIEGENGETERIEAEKTVYRENNDE